jgi:hypothetical protein
MSSVSGMQSLGSMVTAGQLAASKHNAFEYLKNYNRVAGMTASEQPGETQPMSFDAYYQKFNDPQYWNANTEKQNQFYDQAEQLRATGLSQAQLYDYTKYAQAKYWDDYVENSSDPEAVLTRAAGYTSDVILQYKPDFSAGSTYKTPYAFTDSSSSMRGVQTPGMLYAPLGSSEEDLVFYNKAEQIVAYRSAQAAAVDSADTVSQPDSLAADMQQTSTQSKESQLVSQPASLRSAANGQASSTSSISPTINRIFQSNMRLEGAATLLASEMRGNIIGSLGNAPVRV